MTAGDAAKFLAGSPERRRLLTSLSADPATPAALAETLDVSRRSVQRHLKDLVDRGWATKTDGRYESTTTGDLVVEEHATYLDALDRIDAFGPLFRHLPDSDHTPELRWLRDATLRTATEQHPQAPVEFYVERVRAFDGDRVRMIAPVLSRSFHRAHADLAFDGVHTDLVLSASTIAAARELNPTEFDVVTSVDVLTVYEYPDDVGFGLTLGDDRLLMAAYDGDGQLRACIESTDPDCYQWAERLFERYVEQSTTIDSPFSVPFPRRK